MKFRRIISKLILLIVAIGALYPVYEMRVVSKKFQQEEIQNFYNNFNVKEKENEGVFSVAQAQLKTIGVLYMPTIDLSIQIYEGTSEYAISEGSGLVSGTGDLSGNINQNPVITSHNGVSDKNLFMNLEKVNIGDTYYIDNGIEIIQYQVISKEIHSPIDEHKYIFEPKGKSLSTIRTCTPTGINSHRLHVVGERVPFDGKMQENKMVFSTFELILMAISFIAIVFLLIWTLKDYRTSRKAKRETNENNIL